MDYGIVTLKFKTITLQIETQIQWKEKSTAKIEQYDTEITKL
jgi:hypothetical protein